eukprot:CAMPEP_0114688074 /NCGR_PEP_ID=MMETSP0191-20121206/63118_1 /TAXON_ID=126664 /ORGANISM="Sorites sp." /LENGTH=54 /DNA_ID=CAMNT_0001975201 /DNA_START=39 /DNA_END=200 /DNA_ORIENTATION=+
MTRPAAYCRKTAKGCNSAVPCANCSNTGPSTGFKEAFAAECKSGTSGANPAAAP